MAAPAYSAGMTPSNGAPAWAVAGVGDSAGKGTIWTDFFHRTGVGINPHDFGATGPSQTHDQLPYYLMRNPLIVSEIIIGVFEDELSVLTTYLLPKITDPDEQTEGGHGLVEWTEVRFDETFADIIPWGAAPDLVTFSRSSHAQGFERRGLALHIPTATMNHPEGFKLWQNMLRHVMGCCIITINACVLTEIFNPGRTEDEFMASYKMEGMNPNDAVEAACEQFGSFVKYPDGIDRMMRILLKRASALHFTPDVIVMPDEFGHTMSGFQHWERQAHFVAGDDGPNRLRQSQNIREWNGMPIIYIPAADYMVHGKTGWQNVQPWIHELMYGHFHEFDDQFFNTEIDDLPVGHRDRLMFNENTDTIEVVSFMDVLRNTDRFHCDVLHPMHKEVAQDPSKKDVTFWKDKNKVNHVASCYGEIEEKELPNHYIAQHVRSVMRKIEVQSPGLVAACSKLVQEVSAWGMRTGPLPTNWAALLRGSKDDAGKVAIDEDDRRAMTGCGAFANWLGIERLATGVSGYETIRHGMYAFAALTQQVQQYYPDCPIAHASACPPGFRNNVGNPAACALFHYALVDDLVHVWTTTTATADDKSDTSQTALVAALAKLDSDISSVRDQVSSADGAMGQAQEKIMDVLATMRTYSQVVTTILKDGNIDAARAGVAAGDADVYKTKILQTLAAPVVFMHVMETILEHRKEGFDVDEEFVAYVSTLHKMFEEVQFEQVSKKYASSPNHADVARSVLSREIKAGSIYDKILKELTQLAQLVVASVAGGTISKISDEAKVWIKLFEKPSTGTPSSLLPTPTGLTVNQVTFRTYAAALSSAHSPAHFTDLQSFGLLCVTKAHVEQNWDTYWRSAHHLRTKVPHYHLRRCMEDLYDAGLPVEDERLPPLTFADFGAPAIMSDPLFNHECKPLMDHFMYGASNPDPAERAVHLAFLFAPIRLSGLENMVRRNVRFPFGAKVFQPCVTRRMVSCLMMKAGSTTGNTILGSVDYEPDHSAKQQLWWARVDFRVACVVWNRNNILIADNVGYDAYMGGHNLTFMLLAHMRELMNHGMVPPDFALNRPSLKAVLTAITDKVTNRKWIMIQGRDLMTRSGGGNTDGDDHYRSYAYYSRMWEMEGLGYDFLKPYLLNYSPEVEPSGVLFRGYTGYKDHLGHWQHIENQGPDGPNVVNGCGRVRNGMRGRVPLAPYLRDPTFGIGVLAR